MTPRQADTLPPVSRAVNLVSGDLARLPMHVQDHAEPAGWETTRIDPVADLLAAPNEYQSAYEWRRTMVRDLMIHGNAASLIRRTRGGENLELVPLMPESFTLHYQRADEVFYTHAELGRMEAVDVLHFRLGGINPLWGDSPIIRGRATLDLLAEQEHTGRMHFRTGGMGKLSLSSTEPLSESSVVKLQAAVADRHTTAGTITTPMILQGGMTADTIGATLSQSEWIEARNFSIRQVAQMFGVPPQLLYAEEGTHEHTYSQLRAYVDSCLSHYAAIFEGELSRKLLAPGRRIHFDFRHLLRGSLDQVVAATRNAIDAGVMTQNEARDLIGLPRHADPIADALVFSKNYAAGGMTDDGNENGNEGATDADE